MPRELQFTGIRNFPSTRDTLVAELEKFSEGDTNGRVVVSVQSFLFRIKNALAMWAKLRWNLRNEGQCFEDRCINLMVLADEMAHSFPHYQTTVINERGGYRYPRSGDAEAPGYACNAARKSDFVGLEQH
jgi:hypothetical protein